MRHVFVEVLVLISLVILELSYAFAPISSYQWVVSYSQRFILGGNKQVTIFIWICFYLLQ